VDAIGYDGPGWRTGVFDRKDWGGSENDWPWRGSSLRSHASWGVCAIVIFISIFVGIFVRPWWWVQSRGGIGSSVGIDIVWGISIFVGIFVWPWRRAQSRGGIGSCAGIDIVWRFGCVVVAIMSVATCVGRRCDTRCDIIIQLQWRAWH